MEEQYPAKEKLTYVMVGAQQVRVSDVEFIDISEDMYGQDELTFKYKGKQYTSLVFTR